jgi:hypothetical protein
MLAGLATIAFPIAILGNKFLELYMAKEQEKRHKHLVKIERKLVKRNITNKEDKLAEKYPLYPPPVRQIKEWKDIIDDEISQLEYKVQKLREEARMIDRAIQLFDWSQNVTLTDTEYVVQLTAEDIANNAPF